MYVMVRLLTVLSLSKPRKLVQMYDQRSVPISSHMNMGMLALFKVPSNSKCILDICLLCT